MEQPSRNLEFMETCFNEIFDKLKLSNNLLEHLYSDPNNPFSGLMKNLKNFNENEKKMYILMQYTKGRHPADYLAQVLTDFGMSDLANNLKKYNRSKKFFDYSSDNALTVQRATHKNTGNTMCYRMEAHPRGVCVIILNEPELENQALAFQYVFEQLYFTVEIWRNRTAQQIKSIFSCVSTNQEYKDMNCLITVAIGHGGDMCFLGAEYGDQNGSDKVTIVELIDMFNEINCQLFRDKPKINIFDCCRQRTVPVDQNIRNLQKLDLAKCFNQDWQNRSAHTTVIYSCAEGLESGYDVRNGFSDYGRAFVHTIAQFACDYHLSDLLAKVNQRLIADGINDLNPYVVKHYCPLNVYFNPGL